MGKCQQEECPREALFKSRFCWEHIQDRDKYKKLILQPGKDGKIKLKGAKLREAELEGADLEGADLMEADLWRANLVGANLEHASLVGADLSAANLREAKLVRADLTEANLVGADFREADLRGANLHKADLLASNLTGANLKGAVLLAAYLMRASLREANLEGADLMLCNPIGANFSEANLGKVDLRNANLNGADLSGATLTGAKVWGMSLAGCKIENIKAEYLNFDKDGNESGIVHLNKEQVDEWFGSRPTIEIVVQNKLSPYAIRSLANLIAKIDKYSPAWGVELKKLTSSSFFSELTFRARRDEILGEVASIILGAFNEEYQHKLLRYLPVKTSAKERALMLKELEIMENKIENPIRRLTIIDGTGKIPVNVKVETSEVRDIDIFGDVAKMISVEGNHYEISAHQGREDLIRNLIEQLDSPEIEKKIKEGEAQLKGLSTAQVKFLEEQFRQSVEKIFKEKQKEVGFFEKVKAFTQRFSESTFSGVIGSAVWFVVQKFIL
jgi:uncharacterized protein YjbI with pentapeptide repeats